MALDIAGHFSEGRECCTAFHDEYVAVVAAVTGSDVDLWSRAAVNEGKRTDHLKSSLSPRQRCHWHLETEPIISHLNESSFFQMDSIGPTDQTDVLLSRIFLLKKESVSSRSTTTTTTTTTTSPFKTAGYVTATLRFSFHLQRRLIECRLFIDDVEQKTKEISGTGRWRRP